MIGQIVSKVKEEKKNQGKKDGEEARNFYHIASASGLPIKSRVA